MKTGMRPVRTLARGMLAARFIATGAKALTNPYPMVDRAKPVTDRIAPALEQVAPWLPTDPATLVRVNGAVQVGSGLMLITGRTPRLAAAVLAGTLVPATLGYRLRRGTEGKRREEFGELLTNLGLLGGLVLAALDTEGRPGVRWRTTHAAGHAWHAAEHAADQARRGAERAGHRARRTARTAKREARIATRAAAAGRRFG